MLYFLCLGGVRTISVEELKWFLMVLCATRFAANRQLYGTAGGKCLLNEPFSFNDKNYTENNTRFKIATFSSYEDF
jgi:hypothetical protein